MTEPLKILLWSPKGAGLHYGGPGMTAYRLYQSAAPGRFRITLVHGSPHQDRYPVFYDQIFLRRVHRGAWAQVRYLSAARAWLAAHAGSFDVFHGLQAYDLTVRPAAYAEKSGVPAVVKIASHRMDLADKQGLRRRLGLARRRRDMICRLSAVIAISKDIVQECLDYGVPESKVVFIPNGVDTDAFRPVDSAKQRSAVRRQLGWRELPTVLFAGGINRRKRPLLIVEALGQLKRQGLECQLVLAGPEDDADYAARMRRRVTELGIQHLVVWFGFTRDVAPLYHASDLFCLPSLREGMPNAVLEAMSSGLPVVLTPISGSRDLLEDNAAGLSTRADPPAIAEAIAHYLRSPSQLHQHGRAARQRVLEKYSARAVLDAHEQLFHRVASGKPAAR